MKYQSPVWLLVTWLLQNWGGGELGLPVIPCIFILLERSKIQILRQLVHGRRHSHTVHVITSGQDHPEFLHRSMKQKVKMIGDFSGWVHLCPEILELFGLFEERTNMYLDMFPPGLMCIYLCDFRLKSARWRVWWPNSYLLSSWKCTVAACEAEGSHAKQVDIAQGTYGGVTLW